MSSTSTTISSNVVMAKNAGGNEYVALLNAVIGNLMRIFLSPASIFFLMKNSSFDQFDQKQSYFDYLLASLLIFIIARLPIRHWRISQKDTTALIFCGATKTLAMGIPLINAVYGTRRDQSIGLVSLPLIIYHVQQLIFGAFQVILLRRWNERHSKKTTKITEESQPMNT